LEIVQRLGCRGDRRRVVDDFLDKKQGTHEVFASGPISAMALSPDQEHLAVVTQPCSMPTNTVAIADLQGKLMIWPLPTNNKPGSFLGYYLDSASRTASSVKDAIYEKYDVTKQYAKESYNTAKTKVSSTKDLAKSKLAAAFRRVSAFFTRKPDKK